MNFEIRRDRLCLEHEKSRLKTKTDNHVHLLLHKDVVIAHVLEMRDGYEYVDFYFFDCLDKLQDMVPVKTKRQDL